ncbi:MAG: metallophosphoesterase, partial [Gammaproteobacteria bacterium]|nr:metallophosphoesterase [Gammaproteobacteria bacterium]
MGRQFAIGDIHGEAKALKALISSLNLRKGDELIFLGDYVDRGADSKAVIDCLINLNDQYDCTFIAGNHEEWMIAALNGNKTVEPYWLKYGGDKTLASYGVLNVEELQEIFPQSHAKFLNNMVQAHETPTHVFVHAGWDSKLALK